MRTWTSKKKFRWGGVFFKNADMGHFGGCLMLICNNFKVVTQCPIAVLKCPISNKKIYNLLILLNIFSNVPYRPKMSHKKKSDCKFL